MEKKLLVKYTDVQICREELTILKHINFELYSGEFVYFIGRVGSGKSRLLKTMYADLPIYEGETPVCRKSWIKWACAKNLTKCLMSYRGANNSESS